MTEKRCRRLIERAMRPLLRNKAIYMALLLPALLLTACNPWKHGRMVQQLQQLQQYNQADSLLTDLPLAQTLADWFDDHGTANEQLLAYYLLGRTHADRGEAPAAIAAYLDATERADTTDMDCDYRTLARVYAQMAWLYHQQLLLSYEKDAHRKACYYDFLVGDTLYALYEQKAVANVYILENKRDSAESLLNDVIRIYRERGNAQEAIQASTMLMSIFSKQPKRLDDLKHLIDNYDTDCELFDENHELPPSYRLYNRYKGVYFEETGQLDSAEYYYRKIYRPGMSFVSKDPLYNGLLNIFAKKGIPDSIVKYAKLYCAVNDSSIAIKDQELTAQMTASHRYGHFQKKALESEEKTRRTEHTLWALSLIALLLIAAGVYGGNRYRKIQRKRREEMTKKYKEEEARLKEEMKKQQRLSIKKEKDLLIVHQREKEELETAYLHEKSQMEEEHRQKMQEMQLSYQRQKEEMEAAQQKERAQWVKQQNGIAMVWVDKSKEFTDKAICKKVARIAKTQKEQMTDNDWKLLTTVFSEHFPTLYKDLCLINGRKRTLRIRIAILTAMGFSNGEQAALLNETKQAVANNMSALNETLFREKTATTFHDNLVKEYNICI